MKELTWKVIIKILILLFFVGWIENSYSRGENINDGYGYGIKNGVIFKIEVNDTTIVDTIAGIEKTIENKITTRTPIDTLKGVSKYFNLVSVDDYFQSKNSSVLLDEEFRDKWRLYKGIVPYVVKTYSYKSIENGEVFTGLRLLEKFDVKLWINMLYLIFIALFIKKINSLKYFYYDGSILDIYRRNSFWFFIVFFLSFGSFLIFFFLSVLGEFILIWFDLWIILPVMFAYIFSFRKSNKIVKSIGKTLNSDVTLEDFFMKRCLQFSYGKIKGVFDVKNNKILFVENGPISFDAEDYEDFIVLKIYNKDSSPLYGWIDKINCIVVKPKYTNLEGAMNGSQLEGFNGFFKALSENKLGRVHSVDFSNIFVNRAGERVEEKKD